MTPRKAALPSRRVDGSGYMNAITGSSSKASTSAAVSSGRSARTACRTVTVAMVAGDLPDVLEGAAAP
jgi:hypothetical protein